MDILAHGLWAGAVLKGVNKKTDGKISIGWGIFWGIFPDLFAFTVPITWLLWNIVTGGMAVSDFPHPTGIEPPLVQQTQWQFQLAGTLYNYSHSLIIFAVVYLVVYLYFRRPVWEMGGWLIHIMLDIPTHTYQFYPTPMFWPISNFEFNGISWGTPLFMIINYTLLVLAYWFLRNKKGPLLCSRGR